MTTDDKRKRRRGVLFSPVLSLQAWRAQHSRRGLEREGLGSEPEVRGSLAVRAPPHPGLVFFTPSHPHRSTRDPTGSGSEECESRRSPSNARGAVGRVRQPPDCGGRRRCGWICGNHVCLTGSRSRTVTVRMSGKDRIEIFPSRM